ncbi:MAG: sulfurtransferase-like selenium metabolism protein YedF [Candidatus Thermoplasmatota archaeon]
MKNVVVLNKEYMGEGDVDLGRQLIDSFLRKLWMVEKKPDAIIFYNSAVKLLAEGSGVIDALQALSRSGVDLIACGTCTSFYNVNEKMKVGRVSNMQEIVNILMRADKVITI